MSNVTLALEAAWKILLLGLLLGAGLPLVFALGIRSLAWGTGGAAETDGGSPHPAGRVLATVCFAVVVVGVGLGLAYIIASGYGKILSFDHIYPTFVPKP